MYCTLQAEAQYHGNMAIWFLDQNVPGSNRATFFPVDLWSCVSTSSRSCALFCRANMLTSCCGIYLSRMYAVHWHFPPDSVLLFSRPLVVTTLERVCSGWSKSVWWYVHLSRTWKELQNLWASFLLLPVGTIPAGSLGDIRSFWSSNGKLQSPKIRFRDSYQSPLGSHFK